MYHSKQKETRTLINKVNFLETAVFFLTAVFLLFLFHCRYSHLHFCYPLTTCSILYISIGIGYRNNFTFHPCTPYIYCLSNKSLLKNSLEWIITVYLSLVAQYQYYLEAFIHRNEKGMFSICHKHISFVIQVHTPSEWPEKNISCNLHINFYFSIIVLLVTIFSLQVSSPNSQKPSEQYQTAVVLCSCPAHGDT